MAYIGNEPFPKGNFSATTHNGGTAVFTMGQSPGTKNAVLVFIDGVRQDPLNYSIAGTTLTLGTAAPAGTNNVQILVSGEELGVNVPADDSVTTAKLANSINTEITANTAKVTNATHTGDVTGATALTIANDAVDIPMLSATGTADATTFLRGDNAWEAAGGGGFDDVYSTVATSVTYTVPTDITKLLVIITGGGGGGAGGTTSGSAFPATSGQGATTVMARVTVVADDTITIEIGAGGTAGAEAGSGGVGGDSTFTHASGSGSGSMSPITAPGGKQGTYRSATTAPAAGTVGANNEGISILGGYGSKGGGNNATGLSGASFWGGGGRGANVSVQVSTVGAAYGSGGGGGTGNAGYLVGAAGADGVCFIMEFK